MDTPAQPLSRWLPYERLTNAVFAMMFAMFAMFAMFVSQISSTEALFDLRTPRGRLAAICCAVNLYRLFVLMSQRLPKLEERMPLWLTRQRGDADVTLTPRGAKKRIYRWGAYEKVRFTADHLPHLGRFICLSAYKWGPESGSDSMLVGCVLMCCAEVWY